MTKTPAFSPMTSPSAVTSAEDAETLTAHYLEVMEALVDVLSRRPSSFGPAAWVRPPNLRSPRPTSPVSTLPTRSRCGPISPTCRAFCPRQA